MKILFIYPNADGYGRIPIGISVISAVLLSEGHQVEVFDTTFILKNLNADNVLREKAKLVLPTDTSYLYEQHTKEEVDERLRQKINKFSPEIVAVSIVEDNYQYADHLLNIVKSIDKNIPIIVGGSTPTIAPEVIIENPNIDYIVQGEGEEPMKEFCALFERKKSVENVKNLWFKKNGKIYNNPPRNFINLDTLPIQNLDLFDQRHFTKAYTGRLYKAGFFEMSRGCMNRCSYCINHTWRQLLGTDKKFFRMKSIDNAIKEMSILKKRHNFEMIFFTDDNFLMMSAGRMKDFYNSWLKFIKLPYWINTTIESITKDRLALLKETGCAGIGLGIESGSEWVRENILRRKQTNEENERGFAIIHDAGIRTTANIMIGFPGEYEADIFESIKLVKRIKPKSIDVTFVSPYIGTAIHSISSKLGLIDLWDKPGFRGMSKSVSMRKGPVIRNPNITFDKLQELSAKFMDYVTNTIPIPAEFVEPAPGADKSAPERADMSREIAEAISSCPI